MAAQPRLKTEVTPPDKKKSIILLRRDMFLVFFFSQCLAVAKTAEIDLDLSKIVKLFAGELWEETTTSWQIKFMSNCPCCFARGYKLLTLSCAVLTACFYCWLWLFADCSRTNICFLVNYLVRKQLLCHASAIDLYTDSPGSKYCTCPLIAVYMSFVLLIKPWTWSKITAIKCFRAHACTAPNNP